MNQGEQLLRLLIRQASTESILDFIEQHDLYVSLHSAPVALGDPQTKNELKGVPRLPFDRGGDREKGFTNASPLNFKVEAGFVQDAVYVGLGTKKSGDGLILAAALLIVRVTISKAVVPKFDVGDLAISPDLDFD